MHQVGSYKQALNGLQMVSIVICSICLILSLFYSSEIRFSVTSDEASPTFSHANANFSLFMDRIRNQFLKK